MSSEILLGQDREAIRSIIDSIGAPVTLTDLHPDGIFRAFAMNRFAEDFYGVRDEDVAGRSLRDMGLRPEGRREFIEERFRQCMETGESLQFKGFSPVDTRSGRRWVHFTMTPLMDEANRTTRIMSTIVDVTELKETEDELAEALTRVLSGYVRICAACKKIHDDNDAWQPIEGYMSRHSGATFSHSMCPECSRVWYGELSEE